MSKNINLIKQFDDQLAISNPDEISLSELIFNLTLEQNARVDEIRRVTEEQLQEVAVRSLTASASEELTTEVKYFNVFRELAHFVSLSTEGPRPNGIDRNTDLLPQYHPSSTAELTLEPTEFRNLRGQWFAADPRIENDEVRSLVASVYSSNPLEPQFQHSYMRLLALPAGLVPREIVLSPITAGLWGRLKGLFKSAVFAGKNSSYWRSLRAKRQLRDSKGRWIEMGGGGTVDVKFPSGKIQSVPGRVAGYSTKQGFIDFEIRGVPGLKDGLYKIPANLFQAVMAILPAEAVKNLPIEKAVADVTDGNFIDINDLEAVEFPEGWVSSPYTPTNKALAETKISPAKHFASADGYEVSFIENPSESTDKKFFEAVKDLYGDKVDVIGTDGTENINWSDPLYVLWASKRGKGSTPIAFAQDWARIQKLASDEDERFGDKENARLFEEERPKQLGPSPKEERQGDEEGVREEVYTGDDPKTNLPEGWREIAFDTYMSKNRKYKVEYGFGETGLETSINELTGEISFIPLYGNGVYNLYERDENGDFTRKFPIPFFTWDMVLEQINAIERLEAVDPLFNPNIKNVPQKDRKRYEAFDPSERFEYDYFGPDSKWLTRSDAIIAEFLSRFYPGSDREEKFNDNDSWSNAFLGASASIVEDQDGIKQIRFLDKNGRVIDNVLLGPKQNKDKALTLALQRLFPRPTFLSNFKLMDAFKDFDITNGRNAQKILDALEQIQYEMYRVDPQQRNKITDEFYMIGKLMNALSDYATKRMMRERNLGPSAKYETPKYRANDHLPPNDAQVKRLVAIFNNRFIDDDPELIKKVRDIKKNPDNYTVREINDLAVYLEKNFRELTSSEKGKLSWIQRDHVRYLLDNKNWSEEEEKDLRDRLDNNQIERGDYQGIVEKGNNLDYKTPKLPEDAIKEANEELEKARIEAGDLPSKKRVLKDPQGNEFVPFGSDLPPTQPKYLKSELTPEQFGPSDGQLAGIERFLEDRQIPEDEREEFLANYKYMNAIEIREWYKLWKSYPFKPEFQPKDKYGLVARELLGASPRMLASIERIFDKGLASEREMAAIIKSVPNMTMAEVSVHILSELKAREDAYDSALIRDALKNGGAFEDLDLVALIGRPNAPEGWDTNPSEAARKEILAEQQEQEEVKQNMDKAARRNAARRTRYGLSRLIAHLAKQREYANGEGRRILDGAIADANDLKRMLDLRIKYVLNPAKVLERLETIRKGLTDSDKAHTYGRIRYPGSKKMKVLEDAASLVGELIGRDGYHNGPYEYDPTAEDEPAESTSATTFEPNPEAAYENPGENDWLVNHPNRPQAPRRLKPKAFWGVVRDWLNGAQTWDDVKAAIAGKDLYFIDFETTGVFDPLDPDVKNDPIQMAIYKVRDGKIIDKIVLYMNPESPLSSWAKRNLRDDKGNPVKYSWLSTLPTKKEAMTKALEFLGKDAVLVGHSISGFDLEVLNRTLREAGFDEYTPAGMIDTLGLADHIYIPYNKDSNPKGPFLVGSWGRSGSTALEAIARYEGVPFTGMHDSANDLDVNVIMLGKMLDRAQANTDRPQDNVFNLTESDNDYDTKRPKFLLALDAYRERAIKFIADMAVKAAANGQEVDINGLVDAVNNANAAGVVDGTPVESDNTAGSTPPPPSDGPITISNVVEDRENGIRPPTPKQIMSVERRLLDPRGIVPAERAKEIWDLLPNLTFNEIGDIVKELDGLELDHAIENNLDITPLRVPQGYDLDKLNAYKDIKYPGWRDKNLGPSPKYEGMGNSRGDLSRLSYALFELENGLNEVEDPKDKKTINDAIAKVKSAMQNISTGPSQKEERPDDRKDKSELAENRHDISFLEKNYTDQQKDVIEAVLRGWSVIIKALAGTGKSTTLIGSAKAYLHYYPTKRILVTAFNNAIAQELRTKFPGNVEVRTMDSISFKSAANSKLSKKFSAMKKQTDFNNRPIYGLGDVADYFKIKDEVELANGEKISKFLFAKIALKGLNNWTISGDEEISRKHFDGLIPSKFGGDAGYIPAFLEIAKKIWEDKLDAHDPGRRQIAVNFNDMMKNFALTHPDLTEVNKKGDNLHGLGANPDLLMIDEAQDVNEVFYKMIEEQESLYNNGIQLVAVGDPHQSIYQFRGAINSLSRFQRDVTLPLTMMFRAGQDVADYANMILEIKDEDSERLVGNPNKTSEVTIPGTMIDPTMILTMTNAGALSEIVPAIGRGQIIGVTREFKADMNSFIATAKWLWFGADEKKRPSNPHEDLDSYSSWKEMLQIHEETKEVPIGKLLQITDMTRDRLETQNPTATITMGDVFKEIQRVVDSARIFGIQGFYKPEDGNWGTSGDLGNYISYRIKNGLIELFNSGDLKPWSPELKMPNNGTRNHSDTLRSLGYRWDTGKSWDWTIPVVGDGSKQLDELVDALSGKDIDVVVLTIHRSKGLESSKVKLGSDIPIPNSKKDAESLAKGIMPKPLSTETLNAIYVGLTRAMDELDPNVVDKFVENLDEFKQKRKDYTEILAEQLKEDIEAGRRLGPSQKQERDVSSTSSDNKYDYTTGWNTEYLGGPSEDSYRHSWSSPDGIYSAQITNDVVTVNKNGSEIFRASNTEDAKADPENIKESSLDLIAGVIESDSTPKKRSLVSEPEVVMTPEEMDSAYTEAMNEEYNYQMSLEPISRDPQYPGGERGLKELEAAINATERFAAEMETPVLDPIPNGLDPEEYVAQLKLALSNKRVELFTDEEGNKFVKISEVANKAAIFDASVSIFANKDLKSSGPSQKEERTNNVKKNKEAVDEVLKGIIAAMDKGIIPWKKPWTENVAWMWPTSGATGKNYKGINLIKLLFISQEREYIGTRWYTKNAIAKMGGYVDSKDAVDIIKVTKYQSKVKPKEGAVIVDPDTGEEKPDDGIRIRTGLDIDFVYNEDVIKGITIPPLKRKEPPAKHEVEQIILDSYKDKPSIYYLPQDEAYWSPTSDIINIPLREQFKSTEDHLDTLFHELVHSTGHPKRLDRKDLLENYGVHKDVRAREELIAEIGSAILAAMFGVNTNIDNVAAYVQSWKRFLETEPNALMEAASLASKAVDHILAGWYENNPDEEYDPEKKTEVTSMPITPITGEDGSSGGLGSDVNYRIEGNRIFLMGDTSSVKDIIKALSIIPNGKKIPFSFFWDRKANNWSISLADPADRVKILEELKAALNG